MKFKKKYLKIHTYLQILLKPSERTHYSFFLSHPIKKENKNKDKNTKAKQQPTKDKKCTVHFVLSSYS